MEENSVVHWIVYLILLYAGLLSLLHLLQATPEGGVRKMAGRGRAVRRRDEMRVHPSVRVLLVGGTLTANESLSSPDGRWKLTQQPDGNLCLRERNHQDADFCSGASKQLDPGEQAFTVFNLEGNLAQYAGTPHNPGRKLWDSQSYPGWQGEETKRLALIAAILKQEKRPIGEFALAIRPDVCSKQGCHLELGFYTENQTQEQYFNQKGAFASAIKIDGRWFYGIQPLA